ncbi:HlyD family efflux transporter periplasmic adaptor subunit [Paenibacillus sp. FSL L8-0436]|uniref:HlyD family efflux transporter periplasmic adaptor subunit n=1 Tax=Paenibacillus sp. FSL L8-0436 TaxID=2954686 RepID=UPI003159429B
MSAKIHNLSEMSDSREIMESKTSPVISIFILILFTILAAALVWSYYGQMDEVSKASAIVRPNEKVSTIQTSSAGKVEQVYIHEGMQIKQGEQLFSFEHKDLDIELSNRNSEINKLTKELQYLQLYKQSISSLTNKFSSKKADEVYYYDMIEQFLLEYCQQQQSFQASQDQLTASILENKGLQESAAISTESSSNKSLQNKIELERKKNLLDVEIANEKLLAQSIKANQNLLPPEDTKRIEQYNAYQGKYVQLSNLSAEKKEIYVRSLSLGNRLVPQSQITDEQHQYESSYLQIGQFQNEAVLSAESNITNFNQQLAEIENSLDLLNNGHDPSVSERKTFEMQKKQLAEQQNDLLNQEKLNRSTEETSLEKLKLDRIVQIHSTIEEDKKALTMLQENVKQIELERDKKLLVAPISGTINILKETNTGDMVQAGESLISIIPTNESKYKMSIAVPNAEAGKITVGNKVDFSFSAFPKQSFGSQKGTITSISTDSIVQQDGMSYYLVEATISNDPLVNRRGERGELRVGMTAQASVITDSKKIIDFVLEKINLKE